MAQKRVLPPRANRGKRPQQSQQQIIKEDALYNHLFQAAQNQPVETQNEKIKRLSKADSQQIQVQHRVHLLANKLYFPYSRGYHYYFDLTTFPRVQGHVSYAIDQDNIFNATYSQQNYVIKDGLTVGKLINRKIFGLPTSDSIHMPRTKDKNICHSYLFSNQDRKFQIDRTMYQLKQILLHFDNLENSGLIKKFSSLKKDIDLLAILQDDISLDEKKNILRKKIKILSELKESKKNAFFIEDKNFYHNSQNQKLYDQIQQLGYMLSYQFLLGQISFAEDIRDQLKGCQQYKTSEIEKIFRYNRTNKVCLSPSTIKIISQKIGPEFFAKKQNQNIFEISVPFIFFSFSNTNIMAVAEKILALRLAHQNQASFFICKIFWKKVFGRDLTVQKQMKPIAKPDYDKSMNQTISQLNKWKKSKQKQGKKDELNYPILDQLINWDVFKQGSNCTDLFKLQNEVQINPRQFICLALFYNLYLSITQIYQFVMNNENISMLMAHDFYSKAHYYMVQCIGTANFGLMDEILRKLVQSLIRSDIDVDYKLKWVYNQNMGVAYIAKTGTQSEWQTQKQDSEENENDNSDEIQDNLQKRTI